MSQPHDRGCRLPVLGELDKEAGEFWVENPFLLPAQGENLSAYERNCLFLNTTGKGTPRFLDASFAAGADIDSDSRSAIAADFDSDGDLDLLIGSVGGGPLRLFLNQLTQGQRITVRFVGTTSNRQGIGCRVTIRCGQRRLVRDNFPANGFMGAGFSELLIGLGTAPKIDELNVRWPTGTRQVFRDLAVNRRYTITETRDQIDVAPLQARLSVPAANQPVPTYIFSYP